MTGYKFYTHDLRSPIQGGEPIWNGETPYILPEVDLDKSEKTCSSGWNFVADIETGFRIVGMWPNGRPSRVFKVEALGEILKRDNKIRTNKLQIISEVSESEINTVIYDFSKVFKNFQKEMAEEQIKWRYALSRPKFDLEKIKEGLSEALKIRGLDWKLKEYKTIRDARDAWYVWNAWDARDVWDARYALDAWDVWYAWDARDAWDARYARYAWYALTVFYSAKNKWINKNPSLLTRGLREAYEYGLELVLPTDKNELGFVVKEN